MTDKGRITKVKLFCCYLPECLIVGGVLLADVALVAVLPAGEVDVSAPGNDANLLSVSCVFMVSLPETGPVPWLSHLLVSKE